jgi:hypothetical protein
MPLTLPVLPPDCRKLQFYVMPLLALAEPVARLSSFAIATQPNVRLSAAFARFEGDGALVNGAHREISLSARDPTSR